MRDPEITLLRIMVRGAYDLQALRIQTGLRLCANFRSRLKDPELAGANQPDDADPKELQDAEEKLIDRLKKEYRTLTDAIVASGRKKRILVAEADFKGAQLISSYAEAVLVDQYVALEEQERKNFASLLQQLKKIPIYTEYLEKVIGVGPAMAAVLITTFDPHKALHQSNFWALAGLDVAPDGYGRSWRKEHLIEREYIDKNGKPATRLSVTYDPWLKSKLVGVLAGSFLRSGSNWRNVYDDYKHRLQSDPARIKLPVTEYKKRRERGDDIRNLWPPGRIDRASKRYMIKMFLRELWRRWCVLENLPTTEDYAVAKLGNRPHGKAEGPRLPA